ncbi:hypothetical protein [Amycolatopsis sp. YIM 10]|uniref:hypothetical protein n=1 Tax=Amycolatopsis sp. YIM 10 TaxID=2653857 RepID=UPI00128FCF6A|nr:hypothetical protein [Amycolatopsis sp. YIM 10]QFU90452.1 hypothetical protein YIM_26390 [Amycolatopsis sp. YIM 10]
MTFPGRAVRGLRFFNHRPANCAPDFVNFTLDFEPLPGGRTGYEFAADLDYGFDEFGRYRHDKCGSAISQGVLANLTGLPRPSLFGELPSIDPREVDRLVPDGPPIAVRVVLAKVRYHDVDSAPGPHCAAAWDVTQRLREALG